MKVVVLIVVLLYMTALCRGADRCVLSPVEQGYWEWRDGTSVAYKPNSFVTSPDEVSFDPSSPSPRHSSATWPTLMNNTVFLFGGIGAPSYDAPYSNASAPRPNTHDGMHNDMWRYSYRRHSWVLVSPHSKFETNLPGVYSRSKRSRDSGSVENGSKMNNGTSSKRNDEAYTIPWPGARLSPSAWISQLDGSLWMFGGLGYGESNTSYGYLNDLWQFDRFTWTWAFRGGSKTHGVPDTINWPGGRSGTVTWTTPDGKLWLFSGYGPYESNTGVVTNRVRNDLWYFDTTTSLWKYMGGNSRYAVASLNQNYKIGPRTDAIFWSTAKDGLIWVYGGYGSLTDPSTRQGYLGDLWAWNITSHIWSLVSPTNVLNEPGFIAETAGVPSPNNKPPARCCAAAFADTRGRLYFFGGFGMSSIPNQPSSTPDFVGDMWVLETANFFRDRAWTWVNGGISKPPPAAVWSSRQDPIVTPGSRAWMECWSNPLTNEAFIFGSLGTSARLSTSTPVPAYYQDLWAYVLPSVNPPNTPPITIAKRSDSTMAIVWAVVGGELLILLLVFLILFFIRRKRQRKLDATDSEMQVVNGNGYIHIGNGHNKTSAGSNSQISSNGLVRSKEGSRSPSSTSPPMTTSTISDEVYPTRSGQSKWVGSVASSNSSHLSDPAVPNGTRSGNPSRRNISRTSTKSVTDSVTMSPSASGTLLKGSRRSSKRHSAGKSQKVKATFDLMIKKRDLEFGNIIGRGSSGTIYSGRWHDQRVAIKQLITEVLVGEREGALEEAKMVGMIRPHPNVIQILGVCVTKQHVFIVMSKMHSSLDKLVYHVQRRKWLTVERMYRMAMGIVAGMIHLESQGICHRDLAARNVCLSKTGTPCITDFGMSRKLTITASAGETNTQMGPVAWMAPECFLQRYSSKSDVWSFGVVLYEMLTGTVPHRGADLHQLSIAIRDRGITPTPIPSDCDHGLVEIMKSCWAFDPADRPSWAQLSKKLRSFARFTDDSEDDVSAIDIVTRGRGNLFEQPKNSSAPLTPSTASDKDRFSTIPLRVTSPLIPMDSEDCTTSSSAENASLKKVVFSSRNTTPVSATTSSQPSAPSHQDDEDLSSDDHSEDDSDDYYSDSSGPPQIVPVTPRRPNALPAPYVPPPKAAAPMGQGDYVSGF